MKKQLSIIIAALLVTNCGSGSATTERSSTSGAEYSIPVPESELPKLNLTKWNIESEGFELKDEDKSLRALMTEASKKIEAGLVSGNNLFVAAASYSIRNPNGMERCIKVQIQQRKAGKIIVKDEIVPEGQAPECKVSSNKGLSTATLGLLVKVGNNYAGGIGVGAVYFDGKQVIGCAAGAVGYITESGSADGVAGAFCTQLVNVPTL